MKIEIAFSLAFFLAFAVFLVGVTTIFIRRHAFWVLVGTLFCIKAVGAMALFLSLQETPAKMDFGLLALMAIGMVPIAGSVGVLVLHRGGRFGGTLDLENEVQLKE